MVKNKRVSDHHESDRRITTTGDSQTPETGIQKATPMITEKNERPKLSSDADSGIYGAKPDNTELYGSSMFRSYPDVLSVKDVMEMLSIGRNKTLELLKTSQIKAVIVGNKYRIPKICVIRFLLGNGSERINNVS